MKQLPPKIERHELRILEQRARKALFRYEVKGICACLAKDVLRLGFKLDAGVAEFFPVFEMVDEMVRKKNCVVVANENGWGLVTYNGEVISEGATMREWLIDHVTKYGEPVLGPEDVSIDS